MNGNNLIRLAERRTKPVSKSLEFVGFLKIKLHVTRFQNVLKLIEHDFSNFPFGYSCGHSLGNFPILRLTFLNLFGLGRGNSQALDEPLTMPRSSRRLMDETADAYKSFSKWSSGKSESLLAGSVVYFKKATNNIPSFWTMREVVSLKLKGAEDKYHDPGKSSVKKQIANKDGRSLVKPLSMEDSTLRKVDRVAKSIEDVKTGVDSNTEFESRIKLLLDKESTCKRCCL